MTLDTFLDDAFGKPNDVGTVPNPYLFNGREYDPESKLYYYRTRYLDPNAGRFTTRDSIGIWGDPNNLGNGYTYTANNPQTFVDPYGLEDILLYYPPGVVNEDFAKAYGEASNRMAGNFLEGAKDSGIAIITSPYTIPASLAQGAGHVYGDTQSIQRGWDAYLKFWEDPVGDYFRNNPNPEDVIDDIAYMSGGGTVDFITGRYLLKFLTKCPDTTPSTGRINVPNRLSNSDDYPTINTPHGIASQSLTPDALELRDYVNNGGNIYKAGIIRKSKISESQFWAPENPLNNSNFANAYGLPTDEWHPNFLMSGTVKPNSPFITRQAPGIGINSGGSLEIVTHEGGVEINKFLFIDE